MNDREALIQALEALTEDVRSLRMAQTVQSSAFVMLARHLELQGALQLDSLVHDLRVMGTTQDESGWKSGHEEIADWLKMLGETRSAPLKAKRHPLG